MGARSAERMMPPLTQTASEALWGRSLTAAGGQGPQSRVDDEDVVVLLSDETAASEAAPLISHNATKLAFCGGVSGALAKTCTAPLARLTILYQVRGLALAGHDALGRQMGVLTALRHISATEGICALWKGNLVTIMHRIPYSATNFFTYESTKRALQGRLHNESARAWAAGAVSGLVACTAAYPLDLLRTRIAAETIPRCSNNSSNSGGEPHAQQQYRRLPSAFRRILAEHGVRGLYKGLGATLVQVVPGLAFNFCFYDTFKSLALKQQQQQEGRAPHQGSSHSPSIFRNCPHPQQQQHVEGQQQQCVQHQMELPAMSNSYNCSSPVCGADSPTGRCRGHGVDPEAGSHPPSPLTSAVCACLSGLCTSSLTFPLDVVRRRLQVYERGALGRMRYLDVVRAVYSEGGLAAFYRGLGPEFAKVLPGMAIAFTTYETMKRLTGVA
ncbi:hypothetical protein VaNZ11_003823 [Volvox africanus]|uniref:Mitochondrial carrier protein n=1 Tax=Volvox africanus TaxID=51714 RepID=A0ABQ5RV38_9CHLO|nr:hypothetical protein VaNZ11_003823 [Volvox africanus]